MVTPPRKKRVATPAEREEEQAFLPDEEQGGEDGETALRWTKSLSRSTSPHTSLPVYSHIHLIRRKIMATVDDPYAAEKLGDPRMAISIVQPLVDILYDAHDISIVYSLLANRVQFLHERSSQPYSLSVSTTRALLCELVAIKILERHDADNSGVEALLLLAKVLVTDFDPFQSAPEEIALENGQTFSRAVGASGLRSTALELAIISESKSLLSSSACQKVIDAVHRGRVVYTPFSPIDLLPDHYKHTPVSIYDPGRAPVLNQYRLIVPQTRYILELCQFGLLLCLYLLAVINNKGTTFTIYELIFCVYAFGWVLDQFASVLEHGWRVYTQNLWSFLDVMFAFTYGIYLILRLIGMAAHNVKLSQLALDILMTAAPVLVPRLAFNIMSNNMIIVALREMMADFAILCLLAVWCSAGFLLAMTLLANGLHNPATISKWLLWVWFGLDGTGIEKSVDFHQVFGPLLMIAFAFLGNTLFLTLLVAMLSNDFSTIVANAAVENQYRRAVVTFGGVKSDSIFAYQPPFNILAICLLLPLKCVFSPRWFHKINVAASRTLNAPVLLVICLYERRYLWRESTFGPPGRRTRGIWSLSKFSVHSGVRAVFSHEPLESSLYSKREMRKSTPNISNGRFLGAQSNYRIEPRRGAQGSRRGRRSLVVSPTGLTGRNYLVSHVSGTRRALKQRVDVLETSTKRIEDAICKLCERLDEFKERV